MMRSVTMLGVLFMALALGACGENAGIEGQGPAPVTIRVHGSTTVGPALEPLSDEYARRHSHASFERPDKYDPDPRFWWRGSEVGVAKVTLGLIDVGGCSRGLKLDELEAARTKQTQLDKLFAELNQPPSAESADALKLFVKRVNDLRAEGKDLPTVAETLKKEFAKEPFAGWIAKEFWAWEDKSKEMSDEARREEIARRRGVPAKIDSAGRFLEKLARLAAFRAADRPQLRLQELRAAYDKNKLIAVALWDLDDAWDLHGSDGYQSLLQELKDLSTQPVTLKAYQVGYDALVPVVNREKRGELQGVTQAQIIALYFTGTIRYWDELIDYTQTDAGTGKPGKKVFSDHTPIKVRSRDPFKSGTGNAFIEVVNKPVYEKKRALAYGEWVEFGEPVQLNQWAAEDGDCFCYNGWGNLPKQDEPAFKQITLLQYAASRDQKKPETLDHIGFVAPGMANFASGLYQCQRPLFVVTNGTPRGEVNRFIQFVLDRDGQRIIQEADFVPVMSR
jgi:ABC-type phosphate transport system substrate-binding protein